MPAGPFSGMANYAIKIPGQAGAYYSYANCQTVQKALEDSIRGFLSSYNIEQLEDTEFIPVKGW